MNIVAYDKAQFDNTAVALGKFEGIHRGHMLLLDEIVSLADNNGETGDGSKAIRSVVFTINMPGEQMINLDSERYEIFDKIGIDIVCECPFDERISRLAPVEFIENILVKSLGARYVVVGSDFRFGYKREGDIDTLKSYQDKFGFKVIVFDKLTDDRDGQIISSSAIRDMLMRGDVAKVRDYMGRAYAISGEVAGGRRLGRTIGFPTINIIPDRRKLIPCFGAYETRVYIEGYESVFKGITNIGDNPTIDQDNNVTVETHILDFSDDIYGRQAKVEFVRFIRSERKFDSIEDLKLQLEADRKSVKI